GLSLPFPFTARDAITFPMAEPQRFTATVRRVWMETPRLTGVSLHVPEGVTRTYVRPGQYVVLHAPDGKKVFLVIASPPGDPEHLDLLLGEAAKEKLAPVEQMTLPIDAAAGNGFPIEIAKDHDVLLFATGSAIAAMRPVVEVIRRHRSDYRRVVL